MGVPSLAASYPAAPADAIKAHLALIAMRTGARETPTANIGSPDSDAIANSHAHSLVKPTPDWPPQLLSAALRDWARRWSEQQWMLHLGRAFASSMKDWTNGLPICSG